MYTLVSALGVSKHQASRWGSVDISNITVKDLFALYRKMYITLSNIYLSAPVTIELESLRLEYSTYNDTFTNFLISIGSRTLIPTGDIPVLNPKYAVYTDAFMAGYKVKPVNILTSATANLPLSEKTSLQIHRSSPETDMKLFFDHCIVSVNGFFHRTDYDGTFAYIVDGANSQLKSHQNQMGILSFLNIGKIENVGITESMIFTQAPNMSLRKRIYVKLNKDITNKSIMLVLGGYLLFPDGKSFFQTGDDTFAIDINRMPFLERFYDAQPYLNYDSLELPRGTNNPSMVNVDELLSDLVLTKYLMLPQTFFCIIDTPEIFTNHVPIRSTGMPGMFIGYKEPKYPLVVCNGKVAEYWKTFEDEQWAINVYDSTMHNRVFSRQPITTLNVVSDSDIPDNPYTNSSGYLLEIGKDF